MRTSFYSILCIAIRLGAAFLAFGALARIPSTILGWKYSVSGDVAGFAAASIAFVLLVALVLWIYPGLLARIAAGRNSREVFESSISPAELQWIALSLLGVYFSVSALITLSFYGMQWAAYSGQYASSAENRAEMLSNASYYVIKLVAGLVLAFGARGLTAMLRRVRYGDAARYTTADEPDSPAPEVTR